MQGTLIPQDRIFLALIRKGVNEFTIKEVEEVEQSNQGVNTESASDGELDNGPAGSLSTDSDDKVNNIFSSTVILSRIIFIQ